MNQSLPENQPPAPTLAEDSLPRRSWHAKGYTISIIAALFMAVAIGVFFVGARGWSPRESWSANADIGVMWILLTYIWIQMGSLILAGAGTRHQMWIDALTSIIPLFVVVYVIVQHYTGYAVLSPFQVRTAWVTAYTMLLDVMVNFGVSALSGSRLAGIAGGGSTR